MTTTVYRGGCTRSRNWGKDENEKGYGTKLSAHDMSYTDDGYTKGRDEEEMKLNHRYQKQFMGRYMVRMGNQTMRYQKNENGNMKEEEAGKVEDKTKSGARPE